MKNKIDKAHIINQVGKALDAQFESYTWEDMLDDCELTITEKGWASRHLSYAVVDDERNAKIMELIEAAHSHLGLLIDAEENIHPETLKELADVKRLRKALEALGA